MNRRILTALVAILVTAAGAPAWAAVVCGDTAAGGARVACACGDTVITNTTVKASDPVVNPPMCTGVGLSIGGNDVTLNCNGLEIRGDPTLEGIGLTDRSGVTVRGCKITGFDPGIRLVRSTGNTLLSNTIRDSGFFGIALEDNSQDNAITSNRVVAPAVDAINLGFGASRNMIASNTLDGAGVSGQDGIDIDGPDATGNTVKGNRISGFPSTGIELDDVDDNVVTDNIARGNGDGIRVHGDGNTIARNTTDENDNNGIFVSGNGNTIDRNRSQLNAAHGFDIRRLDLIGGTGNTITRNTASFNGGDGISVSGDGSSIIDQNRGQANVFNGLTIDGTGSTITRNIFDANGFDGISFFGDGSIIDENRGRLNGFNGLTVGGDGNTVAGNTFNDNGALGICVSPGNTDGGMNRATGNGDPGNISFEC